MPPGAIFLGILDAPALILIRNHAVGFGERTRLACYRRRLAVDIVKTIFSPFSEERWRDEVCGETPQTLTPEA